MLSPTRDSVAIAPRPAENSERNVVLDPLSTGCARVHAPSPSWNATHAGWMQYATATLTGGGGGGGTDGNVPSEQAVTAAISNRTQDLVDMERLREGRSGTCRSPITGDLQRAIERAAQAPRKTRPAHSSRTCHAAPCHPTRDL